MTNSDNNKEKLVIQDFEISWLKDFVVCFDQILPPDLCCQIIKEFEKDDSKQVGQTYTPGDELAVNSDKTSIDLEIMNTGVWEGIHNQIIVHTSKALKAYTSLAPGLQVGPLIATGFNVKRYDKDVGEFKWHFDALYESSMARQIAFVIYLNDVDSGGETEFFHQQVKAKPKQGSGVIFPTFWTHMHRGCIPTSGPKYILTSFARFGLEEMAKSKTKNE